ncbi:hypothetical protein WG66_006031, partial [Moniliophthora roreri]
SDLLGARLYHLAELELLIIVPQLPPDTTCLSHRIIILPHFLLSLDPYLYHLAGLKLLIIVPQLPPRYLPLSSNLSFSPNVSILTTSANYNSTSSASPWISALVPWIPANNHSTSANMVPKLFAHILLWIPSPVTLESCTITSKTSLFH